MSKREVLGIDTRALLICLGESPPYCWEVSTSVVLALGEVLAFELSFVQTIKGNGDHDFSSVGTTTELEGCS